MIPGVWPLPLMNSRQQPFGCAYIALMTAAGMFAGIVFGWLYGRYEANLIAEEVGTRNPDDPLDMFHFVSIMYISPGAIGGALVGAATALYVRNRKRGKRGWGAFAP